MNESITHDASDNFHLATNDEANSTNVLRRYYDVSEYKSRYRNMDLPR